MKVGKINEILESGFNERIRIHYNVYMSIKDYVSELYITNLKFMESIVETIRQRDIFKIGKDTIPCTSLCNSFGCFLGYGIYGGDHDAAAIV